MRLLLLLVLLVSGCVVVLFVVRARRGSSPEGSGPGASSPRDGGTDAGAAFRVEARVELRSETNPGYETSRLDVVLRNSKGSEVETPGTELELDGVPLTYTVGRGNFYDRHPYYRLREGAGFRFEPDAPYTLATRQSGGPPLPLAAFRTPKRFSTASFQVPASHPGGRDLVISWKGLPQPADLLVYRTLASVDERGDQTVLEGGPYGDDTLRRRIGSRELPLPDGSTVIPAAYLGSEGDRVVTSVTLEVTATSEGRFLRPVLQPSTATATRTVVLRVDVTPPSPR